MSEPMPENPFISPDDLTAFIQVDEDKARDMIKDALALAALAAPCINDPEFLEKQYLVDGITAVIRRAIIRWHDAGVGAIQQVGSGSFQQTTMPVSPKGLFWPSEIEQLREICQVFRGGEPGKAFSVDRAPVQRSTHLPWCNLMFGAKYCSCGTDIAGRPIYENKPGL